MINSSTHLTPRHQWRPSQPLYSSTTEVSSFPSLSAHPTNSCHQIPRQQVRPKTQLPSQATNHAHHSTSYLGIISCLTNPSRSSTGDLRRSVSIPSSSRVRLHVACHSRVRRWPREWGEYWHNAIGLQRVCAECSPNALVMVVGEWVI